MEEDREDHENMDVMGCEVTGIAIGDGDGDGDGWVMAVRWLWPSGMDGQWMGEWRRLAEVVARRERDTMSFVAHFAFRISHEGIASSLQRPSCGCGWPCFSHASNA